MYYFTTKQGQKQASRPFLASSEEPQSASAANTTTPPATLPRRRRRRIAAVAEGVSSFSWPPFEAAYFFSEFTVRASTPLLQLLVQFSKGSWRDSRKGRQRGARLSCSLLALQGCCYCYRKALAVS